MKLDPDSRPAETVRQLSPGFLHAAILVLDVRLMLTILNQCNQSSPGLI